MHGQAWRVLLCRECECERWVNHVSPQVTRFLEFRIFGMWSESRVTRQRQRKRKTQIHNQQTQREPTRDTLTPSRLIYISVHPLQRRPTTLSSLFTFLFVSNG